MIRVRLKCSKEDSLFNPIGWRVLSAACKRDEETSRVMTYCVDASDSEFQKERRHPDKKCEGLTVQNRALLLDDAAHHLVLSCGHETKDEMDLSPQHPDKFFPNRGSPHRQRQLAPTVKGDILPNVTDHVQSEKRDIPWRRRTRNMPRSCWGPRAGLKRGVRTL